MTTKSPRKKATKAASVPHLPDPKTRQAAYRPFTSDPGWDEAWWWLGFPVLVAVFVLASYAIAPEWYRRYVLPEGSGILELSHFVIPLIGLAIAAPLLFRPFVRARPLVFAVALIGALSCLYIAGEEMSWGQHFFYWDTPGYWAEVNRQQETNLHNTISAFDQKPRSVLEILVVVGGLLVPLAAAFDPRVRANRFALFLPPAAIVPAAIGAMAFKIVDRAQQAGYLKELLQRPSETVETYLYFFILVYLIAFARRIKELEASQGAPPK